VLSLLRKLRLTGRGDVTFCDSCGQACTSADRSAARYDRAKTAALPHSVVR